MLRMKLKGIMPKIETPVLPAAGESKIATFFKGKRNRLSPIAIGAFPSGRPSVRYAHD